MKYTEQIIVEYNDIIQEWLKEDGYGRPRKFFKLIDHVQSIRRKKRNYISSNFSDWEASMMDLFERPILDSKRFNDEKEVTSGYIEWGEDLCFALSCGPYCEGYLEFYLHAGQGSCVECRYAKRTTLKRIYTYDFFHTLLVEKGRVYAKHARQIKKAYKTSKQRSEELNKQLTTIEKLVCVLRLYGIDIDNRSKKKLAAMHEEFNQIPI